MYMKITPSKVIASIAVLFSFTGTAIAQYLDSLSFSSDYQAEFSDMTTAVNTPGNLNFTAQTGLAAGFDSASNDAGSINQLVLGGVYDIVFIGEHAGWTGNDLDILFYDNAD